MMLLLFSTVAASTAAPVAAGAAAAAAAVAAWHSSVEMKLASSRLLESSAVTLRMSETESAAVNCQRRVGIVNEIVNERCRREVWGSLVKRSA
mgnify:CR=1 FL=1